MAGSVSKVIVIGKSAVGRQLDGHAWSEYPVVRP